MATLHTRHWAFGVALPIITIVQGFLASQATPEELNTATSQAAFILPLVSTILAGFVDIVKGWVKGPVAPSPAPAPTS